MTVKTLNKGIKMVNKSSEPFKDYATAVIGLPVGLTAGIIGETIANKIDKTKLPPKIRAGVLGASTLAGAGLMYGLRRSTLKKENSFKSEIAKLSQQAPHSKSTTAENLTPPKAAKTPSAARNMRTGMRIARTENT